MRKYVIATSLALGIAFDILFWRQMPGISFPVFVVLFLLTGFLVLRKQKVRPDPKSVILLVPILFFAVMSFIRLNLFTYFLNVMLTIFCTAVLAMTYRSGRWTQFGISDYVRQSFRLIASVFTSGWHAVMNKSADQEGKRKENHKNKVWPILRGVLLAIPILLLFTTLLASADLVFAKRLNDFFANFNIEKLREYIFRGSYILIIAYTIIGIFTHAENRSENKQLIGIDKPGLTPSLGFTEATIVLGSVVALFSVFVAIQFKYFFFGQTNITQEGFTYSEYARRGFGELVAVAVFSLLLIQILSIVTKRIERKQRRIFSGLVIGLVVMVIIILGSSFQRLTLYEIAYGFSQLRVYAHVFMIWLGILLAAVVVLEARNHQRAFANAAFLATMGFAATLNLMNVNAFIVHQNIKRARLGKELDISYLSSLHSDAMPALVKYYRSANLSSDIRDGVGAAMVCYLEFEEENGIPARTWQSFHYSQWKAAHHLNLIQNDLDDYQIVNEEYPISVTSHAGTEYACGEMLLFD